MWLPCSEPYVGRRVWSLTFSCTLTTPAGALLLSFAPLAKAQNSIYEVVNATPDLSTLKAAIDTAGLAETLSNVSLPYTVFAPDNSVGSFLLLALQLLCEPTSRHPLCREHPTVCYIPAVSYTPCWSAHSHHSWNCTSSETHSSSTQH